MQRYPDSMPLADARALFFRHGNLGHDGGYSSRWVRVEAKPFPVYFPNTEARVAAARLHDLHHIAAEYDTDWPGEIEISGWEIGSGCGRFYAAWVLDLGGWAVGLLLAPLRLFRAFVRGRRAATNLYHIGFREAELQQTTVGTLRDRLGVREDTPPRATAPDALTFGLWSTAAVAFWLGPPVLAAAAGCWWLRCRRGA
jgi:hypothetical protein